jgi:homoserine O-acetyltransferase
VLQLAVTYPDFADRIVATGATARTYPTNYMMLESAITSLQTDPAFQGGDYTEQPQKGMMALRTVMVPWIHAQEYWRQELWRPDFPPGTSFKDVYEKSRANLLRTADANNVILQMRTWQQHDVGGSPGFDGDTTRALRSIKMPVMYMPSETDLYFTMASAKAEADLIPHGSFKPIPSLLGHPGALAGSGSESNFLRENIRAFLEN